MMAKKDFSSSSIILCSRSAKSRQFVCCFTLAYRRLNLHTSSSMVFVCRFASGATTCSYLGFMRARSASFVMMVLTFFAGSFMMSASSAESSFGLRLKFAGLKAVIVSMYLSVPDWIESIAFCIGARYSELRWSVKKESWVKV